MVHTRGSKRRDAENIHTEKDQNQVNTDATEDIQKESSSIKLENQTRPNTKVPSVTAASNSKRSTVSVESRKRQLILEAEKKKAKIRMQLIDAQLETDLAKLEDEEYSPQNSQCSKHRSIENWLERSQQELDRQQTAPKHGHPTGVLQSLAEHPIPATDGLIQSLATAVKNLSTASCRDKSDAHLLSRMCTPRDLPNYSGDPLEWLQFKKAYEESTDVCSFTPKENLWRLRKCLHSKAKEAVSALLISATSPDRIMATLELQFGNPDGIISRLIQDIKRLQSLTPDYQKDIVTFSVKVQNFVEAVRAIDRPEYVQGMSMVSLILSKLPSVLISKWSDYSYPLIKSHTKPTLELLSEFLTDEAIKTSTTTANIYDTTSRTYHDMHKSGYKQTNSNNHYRSQTVLLQAENHSTKCQFCRVSIHKLYNCKQFKKALRKVRWAYVKRHGICFKCLESKHNRDTCAAPVCDKEHCGQAHHNLLHFTPNNYEDVKQSRNNVSLSSDPVTTTQTVAHINENICKILLKVVPIRVYTSNNKYIDTSALLDDGSTVTLISAELASRAGLRGRTETMRVCGPWSNNEMVCDTTVLNLRLSGLDNKVHCIKARSVDKLDLPIQKYSIVDCNKYLHLTNIKDKLCNLDVKPQVLIGQDNYNLLLPLKMLIGKCNEPSATLTPLGWSVHGSIRVTGGTRGTDRHGDITLLVSELDTDNRTISDHELHQEVRRYFELESMGVSGKPRCNIDDAYAVEQVERSACLIEGRWQVDLPWKDPNCITPDDTYTGTLRRLKAVERKMVRDPPYAQRYRERMNHLFTNQYAVEMDDTQRTNKTWYLPHFGVDNPNKSKLRLVFDAADNSTGLSLNDYLLKGPDLLNSLFDIMLRFRENKIAIMGDIKDMFLRINMSPRDRDAFRFLWRDNPTEPIKTYDMNSLLFGAKCSPFIAQYIKNKNALQYESSMPLAVDAIINSHYMDDYIQSFPDEVSALKILKDVSFIHKQGGFHMVNWASNSIYVLQNMSNDTLSTTAVKLKIEQQCDGERTLGLLWLPSTDELSFDVSFKRIPEHIINGKQKPTKRIMLRVIMSIFDVFGLLAPFLIQGKIMLQDVWRDNINWDEDIPDVIYKSWRDWIESLNIISKIKVPRWYRGASISASETHNNMQTAVAATSTDSVADNRATTSVDSTSYATNTSYSATASTCERIIGMQDNHNYNNLELHVFCDASQKAYCAVAYWRWTHNNKIHVAFIASKSRVAPVKPVTIPRLELQAALLGARLARTITSAHNIKAVRRLFWCDSTTVLHWLRNNKRTYKTFEANRLGEIDECTSISEWRYIPTDINVADIATRDNFKYDLFMNSWLLGPTFLHLDESSWPCDVLQPISECIEINTVGTIQNISVCLPVPDPCSFSSWLRLLWSTAMVLKFINKCRRLTSDDKFVLMERAERLLLKQAQADNFIKEITLLKMGKCIPSDSRLRTLSPYLDEHGLLRVDGRIDAALNVSAEVKRPIILDGRHPTVKLLIMHFHIKAAHGNREMVVNDMKQKYWVVRIRPAVRSVTSKCLVCRMRNMKPSIPRMGDLPQARMEHHQRPFTHCGIDLFGPIEVAVCRRREKRYGVLFTCLTVRAVHIELVHSLTTDSLIMALRRMAARRGWPRHIYSDNGTNLKGADSELCRSIQELDPEILKTEAANNGTQWSFIPPGSPHWGGAWERLIRSVKTSLRVILKERAPRDETLLTLLAEVEAIVNGRPLTHVSVEPGSSEALTPNHFLLGSSNVLPTLGKFDDSDLYLRKQWRKAQKLADMYWNRWLKEYLPELVGRSKWNSESKPIAIGDFVFIVDPNSPRNVWPKGVVVKVFPGKDDRVRVVEVKTASGTLRRSVARVAPVPLVSEC